jgi:hypothetical protein
MQNICCISEGSIPLNMFYFKPEITSDSLEYSMGSGFQNIYKLYIMAVKPLTL